MLEVKDLRLVHTVATCGSVTRAAQKIHITQSGLSHQLADLEYRLGTPIFFRLHGRMVPTPAGEKLLADAPALLQKLQMLEDEVKQIAGGSRGKLRVSSECYTCYTWIPRVLPKFNEKFPGVELEIVAEATWQSLEALLDGRIDISFSHLMPRDRRLTGHDLFRDEMLGIVSPQHPLAGKKYLEPADFAAHTMLLHNTLDSSYVYQTMLKPADVVPAKVISIGLTEAVLESAAAGVGIGTVARWAAQNWLESGRVLGIRLSRNGIHREWKAVSLKSRKRTPHEQYFLQLLANGAPRPA